MGKFGERPNQTQVTMYTKPGEFFQIIQDDRQVIHRTEIANEHMIEVFHLFQKDCDPVQNNVNIFFACFTTSHARLRLYKALVILQEGALYGHRLSDPHSKVNENSINNNNNNCIFS